MLVDLGSITLFLIHFCHSTNYSNFLDCISRPYHWSFLQTAHLYVLFLTFVFLINSQLQIRYLHEHLETYFLLSFLYFFILKVIKLWIGWTHQWLSQIYPLQLILIKFCFFLQFIVHQLHLNLDLQWHVCSFFLIILCL